MSACARLFRSRVHRGLDSPADSTATRKLLGWEPTGPGLMEDLDMGHYFTA